MNTGVGCHFLLQGIFLIQGLIPGLLHCRQTLYHLNYQGTPENRVEALEVTCFHFCHLIWIESLKASLSCQERGHGFHLLA